jgi:hypothetical protein
MKDLSSLLSLFVCLMVFNATFNKIAISVAVSFIGGGPGENH